MTTRFSDTLATLAVPLLVGAPWVYADAFVTVYALGVLTAAGAILCRACGD